MFCFVLLTFLFYFLLCSDFFFKFSIILFQRSDLVHCSHFFCNAYIYLFSLFYFLKIDVKKIAFCIRVIHDTHEWLECLLGVEFFTKFSLIFSTEIFIDFFYGKFQFSFASNYSFWRGCDFRGCLLLLFCF